MTNQINNIVEHLFHKKRLDDVSVYEIERFIATHPYFAAGHFLLAKKTQLTDPHQTHDKVATTLLYYNNPLWLQWLLDQDITPKKQEEKEPVTVYHEKVTEQDVDEKFASGNGDQHQEIITQPEEERDVNSNITLLPDEISTENSLTPGTEIIHDDNPAIQEQVDSDYGNELVNDPSSESPVTPSQPEHPSAFASPEVKLITTETEVPGENLQSDDSINNFNQASENVDEPTEDPSALPTTAEDQPGDSIGQSPETKSTPNQLPAEKLNAEEEESRATAASIGRTLTTAALIPTRAEMEKGEFTFEPYHTIDYFASQGIKLQQSDLSRDKFGKQLKSFTEWLKSMKRLPQAVAEANMDEATQQSIQRIAEHSFEEKDIVTETMVEVWIKQGNKEKAIATLHKLSLLNPSKSHYFAAKIEQLKAS